MTSTIRAEYQFESSAFKATTTADTTASAPSTTMGSGVYQGAFNGTTTPNGTECWSGHVALVAGAATIDLTSLTQVSLNVSVNATGLKLRFFVIQPDATNANAITVGTGATNGYPAMGVQSQINNNDIRFGTTASSVAIDSTHKTLDLAGTGTQGCSLFLVFGS